MHPNEIRASFLAYFERNGHRVVPSSPLVPSDDPTLLFTNAGMNQFKDLFLGRERRDYTRAATAQKCMRVSGKHNDLDNVGPSFRHHTLFEMLGNFSFGDYFKADAIPLAWQLLTREWGLDPSRLHATIFRGEQGVARDDEAYTIWRQFLPAERIGELGSADNFWAMGETGPCGRCSEIYYDRGPQAGGTGDLLADVEAGNDRFVEIWNNVFMEFERQADGRLHPLPAPSIDTGMGLERVSAVLRGVLSNYDTELFIPLLQAIGELCDRVHGGTLDPADVSMRVVADHARATTFLIADGVVPSNEWRGYVLRKIMRRAMRHGRKLGLQEPFLYKLVDVLVAEMGGAYPELTSGRDTVVQVVRSEEERFDAVLTGGLARLEEVLDRAARGSRVVPGDETFRLYDTFGLPRDFMEDLAGSHGLAFDAEGFDRAMAGQREKARAKSAFEGGPKGETFVFTTDAARDALRQGEDSFVGYELTTLARSEVVALFDEGRQQVASLSGRGGFVVLAQTPFYLEAGGQVSDRGRLQTHDGRRLTVSGVVRLGPGLLRAHKVDAVDGTLSVGDVVAAIVDVALRDATRRNHTATHLLHAALREALGGHVRQAGSLVAPDRLRFDFMHFSAVTPDELRGIELRVNEAIVHNEPVSTAVKNTQEAIASGAMALFGEKYGDRVRVVAVGDGAFSTELCGGTHVRATGDIGTFLILEETGVAAGVRRIEALTGPGAVAHIRGEIGELLAARADAHVKRGELSGWLASQRTALSKAQKEAQQLRAKVAMGGAGGEHTAEDRVEVNGVTLVARALQDIDKASLRSLADDLKSKLQSGIVFLAGTSGDGKVSMIASVTPDLVKRAPAGQLVKQLAPIVGGGGGGRPDFAEAGGKDPSKVGEMVDAFKRVAAELLSAS